jgi:hypothetical protein
MKPSIVLSKLDMPGEAGPLSTDHQAGDGEAAGTGPAAAGPAAAGEDVPADARIAGAKAAATPAAPASLMTLRRRIPLTVVPPQDPVTRDSYRYRGAPRCPAAPVSAVRSFTK